MMHHWECVIVIMILFGVTKSQTKISSVKSIQMKDLRSQVRNVTTVQKTAELKKSSLAFVFDITGSMYDDLMQLREGAHMILDAIVQNPNAHISNFILVPFEDPGYGPATVTEDPEKFREALNKLELFGGGDCPEMALSGIREALIICQPMSYIYVFTDASATDHFILSGLLDQVQRKQSQIVFILTGDCRDRDKPSFQAYHKLAAASSGQVFELKKTNVHKVLQFVKNAVAERRVNLGSVTNPAGYNYTQEVPVDKTLGEVTVSVSGSSPRIKVVDPKGEEVTGPPKLVKTLDLDAIMVVNLLNPEPGNWSITVGSSDQHSVKVTGLSNFTFQHGFSVHTPRALQDTSRRPLQGAENILMISPSGADQVDVKFAEIVTTDGKLLFELPLKRLDDDKSLYITGPFLPPDDFFYIAVNGVDENGNNARRIGPTAIQPQLPDFPFLTVTPSLEAHIGDTVVLNCEIESLVPVTAQWFKHNKRLQEKVSSLQSTSVEYVINSLTTDTEGSYRCVASNTAGFSKAVTNVSLAVDPPVVTLSPGNTTVPTDEVVEAACSVTSLLPLTDFQFYVNINGTSTSVFEKIPQRIGDAYSYTTYIAANMSSSYSCRARNKGGESIITSYIHKLRPLKANIEPKPILTELHRSVNLTCRIENGDSVVWTDPTGINRSVTDKIGIERYDCVFTVDDVNISDGGIWTCVTVRGRETVSDSARVVIKPIVQELNVAHVVAHFGENVTIECHVTASEPTSIIWRNENREPIPANTTKREDGTVTSTAVLRNVTNKSKGTYYCEAENEAGIDSKHVTLSTWRRQTVVELSRDLNIDIYSSGLLICHIESHPPSMITWSHNGTEIEEANKNVVYKLSKLYIRNMDFSKAGLYECVATNEYGTMSYNVTVGISGLEFPELEKISSKLTAMEGDTVQISCRVQKGKPPPVIRWQKQMSKSTEFTDVQEFDTRNNNTSFLNLTNLRTAHNGIYRCRAENLLGSDIQDVDLMIQYPPRLDTVADEPAGPIEVEAGHSLTLSCRVVGEPRPLITWTKDGMPVSYSDNIHLEDTGNLLIDAVNEYDGGVFLCTATSTLGSIHKNFTLIVVAPPSILDMGYELDPEIERLEGELVELPCSAKGLPRPRVEWRHDNQTIQSDGRRQIDGDFTLRFVANLTDFGEYKCVAVNKAGDTSRTYFLFIWVTPYMDLPYETIESSVGEAVTLKCDAVGFPVPIITWVFGDRGLDDNHTGVRYNDTGYAWISNVTTEHGGTYVCSAHNRAGVAQKRIRLNVNQKPQIMGTTSSRIVVLTSDLEITLPCVAKGQPKPHVLWFKNDKYIQQDSRFKVHLDGTLTIHVVTADLSGNYTCEAINRVGRDTRLFPVQVYSPPTEIQMDESESHVVMVEGTNGTLLCPVKSSDGDTIKWYKNGQYLEDGSVLLQNVSRSNASSYACVVSNVIGSASASVHLTVEWAPEFKTDVQMQWEVVQGDDVFLNCESDAKPKAQTKWFLDSKPLPSDGAEKLELRDIGRHHAGVYMCVVTNAHGIRTRKFNITILIPPEIRAESEVEIDFKEGSYATLQCSSRGMPKPTVTWHYNNTDWLIQNNSLVCKNTTRHAQGVFQCVSRNKAGAASLLYRVNVLSPAVVKEITMFGDEGATTVLDKVEVVVDQSIRISCAGEGTPTPEVEWNRDGSTVSSSDPRAYYSDLKIGRAQRADEGAYVCIAYNEAGRMERTIHLHVLTKPKIFKNIFADPNETTSESVEVMTGQPFRLHCHPHGAPAPALYWFRDDQLLRFYDEAMYTEGLGEVLYVRRSVYDDAGNYTCVARNKAGEDSVSYIVSVLVPPTSEFKDNETIKVRSKLYSSLKLRCSSSGGNPPPRVAWMRHVYTEINVKAFPNIQFEDNNSTLVILNATAADSGLYSCLLTNKVGTLEVTFRVTVERAPVIASNDRAHNNTEVVVVPLKRSVILECPAEGSPLPTITWWKDTLVLSTNMTRIERSLGGAVLSIRDTTPRDAGQYICVAENSAGSAHRRYNLRVTVPGEWSKWSAWSLCNVTCGQGAQRRHRDCYYLGDDGLRVVGRNSSGSTASLVLDEAACKGPADNSRPCHMPPCEEDGESGNGLDGSPGACVWAAWSAWGKCGAHCTQARTRYCRCPYITPVNHRDICQGDNVQIRQCLNVRRCNTVQSSEHNSEEKYLPEITYEMEPEAVSPPQVLSRADSDDEAVPYEIAADTNVHTITCEGSKQCGESALAHSGNSTECVAGFHLDPTKGTCEDVDECLVERNKCHSTQLCENVHGGYRCYCQPGYSSLGPGHRCLDMNECELDLHRCEYACVNTAGGYVCACPRGLRLRSDQHRCRDPRNKALQDRTSLHKNTQLVDRDSDRYTSHRSRGDNGLSGEYTVK